MDALEVSCPECHARKRKPCVYIQPKAPPGTLAWHKQQARAGQPTKRPHNGRMQKAYFTERARELNARQEEYARSNAAGPTREAILRANAQAVADEHTQLKDWLRQHASVLTG